MDGGWGAQACVSMMYHAQRGFGFDGDWAQWLELWLSGEVEFGSWFDHTFGWWNATKEEGNAERIMFITYEQLQFENRKTVASLASFIGVSGAGDALFDKVEAAASFGTMQAQAQQRADKGQSAPTGNAASAGNPGFFRKGEVGDWRNRKLLKDFVQVVTMRLSGTDPLYSTAQHSAAQRSAAQHTTGMNLDGTLAFDCRLYQGAVRRVRSDVPSEEGQCGLR